MGTISIVFLSHAALSLGLSRLLKETVLWQINTLQFVYKVTPTTLSSIREPESFWSLSYFPGCVSHYPYLSVLLSPGISALCCCFPNSFPPLFSSSLCAFPFCHPSSVCLMCKRASTRLFIFRMLYHVLFVSYVAVQFLSLFPCTDLAFPTMNILCLFSTLFLFLTLSSESQLSTGNHGWGK